MSVKHKWFRTKGLLIGWPASWVGVLVLMLVIVTCVIAGVLNSPIPLRSPLSIASVFCLAFAVILYFYGLFFRGD